MSSQGEANGEGSPPTTITTPPPPPSLAAVCVFPSSGDGRADKQKRWPRFKSSRRCGSGGHLGAHLGAAALSLVRCEGRGLGGQEGWQRKDGKGDTCGVLVSGGGSGEAKPEQNQGLAVGVKVRRRKGSAGWRGHERNDPCCRCGVRRLGASRGVSSPRMLRPRRASTPPAFIPAAAPPGLLGGP